MALLKVGDADHALAVEAVHLPRCETRVVPEFLHVIMEVAGQKLPIFVYDAVVVVALRLDNAKFPSFYINEVNLLAVCCKILGCVLEGDVEG